MNCLIPSADAAGVVPSGTWRTADGKYVVIGGNGDSVYGRLMAAIGRADIGPDNPRFASNAARCDSEAEIMEVLYIYDCQIGNLKCPVLHDKQTKLYPVCFRDAVCGWVGECTGFMRTQVSLRGTASGQPAAVGTKPDFWMCTVPSNAQSRDRSIGSRVPNPFSDGWREWERWRAAVRLWRSPSFAVRSLRGWACLRPPIFFSHSPVAFINACAPRSTRTCVSTCRLFPGIVTEANGTQSSYLIAG
jgi:CoA-transferase family III